MTTIFAIGNSETATLASDAAGYDSSGVMRCEVTKQVLLASGRWAAAISGEMETLSNFYKAFAADQQVTIDDILSFIPRFLRTQPNYVNSAAPSAVFLIGWSKCRSRMEMWQCSSASMNDVRNGSVIQPFEMINALRLIGKDFLNGRYPVTGMAMGKTYQDALPTGDLKADFDMLGGEEIALRQIQRQRVEGNDHFEKKTGWRHLVGGFLEATTISRQSFSNRLLCQWPDPVGFRIDPTKEVQTC